MKLKYIIDDHNNFLLFSETITHSSVNSRDIGKIVGAGFATMATGYDEYDNKTVNVHCFGKSVSLNIESREEDEKIINQKLNNKY